MSLTLAPKHKAEHRNTMREMDL
uniref:Uncharacterized protein n=1 Tax=Anguilla anguilla TaxID=7936 RepID=A0A0E9SD09_ANGAN